MKLSVDPRQPQPLRLVADELVCIHCGGRVRQAHKHRVECVDESCGWWAELIVRDAQSMELRCKTFEVGRQE